MDTHAEIDLIRARLSDLTAELAGTEPELADRLRELVDQIGKQPAEYPSNRDRDPRTLAVLDAENQLGFARTWVDNLADELLYDGSTSLADRVRRVTAVA